MILKDVAEFFKEIHKTNMYYYINKPIRWCFLFVILSTIFPVSYYLLVYLNFKSLVIPSILPTLFLAYQVAYIILSILSFGSILKIMDKFLNLDKYFPPDRENKIYDIKKRTEVILAYFKNERAKYIFLHILFEIPVTFIFIYFVFIFIVSTVHLNIIAKLILGGFCFGVCYALLSLLMGFIMYPIVKPCSLFESIREAEKEYLSSKKLLWISICLISLIFFIFTFEKFELYKCFVDFPFIPEVTRIFLTLTGIALSPVFTYLILFLVRTEKVKPEIKRNLTGGISFIILFLPCLYVISVLLNHLVITKALLTVITALGGIYSLLLVIFAVIISKFTKNYEKFHYTVSIFMVLSLILIFTADNFKLYKYPADLAFSTPNNIKMVLNQTKSVELGDYVITDNPANRLVEFHYYIPAKINKNKLIPLIVVPSYMYEKDYIEIQKPVRDFADKEGFIVIASYFMVNMDDYFMGKGFNYPSIWSGKAILDMTEKLKQIGYILSKPYMLGAYNGADFNLRFTNWKPDYCVASAIYGQGGKIVLPETANSTKFFLTVGIPEQNYAQQKKNSLAFYDKAKKLGINVSYKEYPDVYSDKQLQDRLNFIKQVRESQ